MNSRMLSPRPSHRRRSILAASALLLSGLAATAATPPNRIAHLETSARTPLAHNVPGAATVAADHGQAATDQRFTGVTLHFSRTAAQEAALAQLLAAQQTPGSPSYHQWLTPQQFGARFGLSAADLAQLTAWLTAQGLTVTEVSPSSTSVSVSGTVAQLQSAFSTSIHSLTVNGEQHISNVSDPQLPAALAAVVTGITGLNDFRPHAHLHTPSVRPAFTSSATQSHFIAPGDFATIYDTKPLLNSAINGTGITIAVMGETDVSIPDVNAFRSAAGLPANPPTVFLNPNGPDPGTPSTGDLQEAQLDLEWSGGTAPGASILYVNSGTTNGVFDSLVYAIAHKVAPILSISYGLCEIEQGAANVSALGQTFEQANAQGQTIISAIGDDGAADCDVGLPAADGLAADFPGSSPNVTGIGGTSFNDATSATYWQAANGSDVISSALSYIPEVAWNDSSAANGLSATGGGASIYFPKPAWQVGAGVPADFARDVPDLAFHASAINDPYLYCAQGFCTSGFRDAAGNLDTVGGTSVGAPSFAGILALVAQKLNAPGGLGNINPVLYGLAGSNAASVFHDITSGNNIVACAAGSPNCGSNGTLGFSATAGYDLTTGLGSVNAYNLANLWSSATPAGAGAASTGATTAIVSLTSTATTNPSCGLTPGTLPLAVAIQTVASSGNVIAASSAGGSVQLLVDGVASGGPVAISAGAADITLNTAAFTSGAHTVSAVYTGDATFAPSRGLLSIDTVSSTAPDFALTPCVPTISANRGAAAQGFTFSVSSVNGFTGPVTFTISADPSLTAEYAFSATPVTVSTSAPVTTVLTLSAFGPTGTGLTPASRQPTASASLAQRHSYTLGGGTAMLASLLCFLLPRRRRLASLLVALVSVGAISMLGCGGGSNVIPAATVTPPTASRVNSNSGIYAVNVTATGTNSAGTAISHTQIVTFTVN